MVTTLLRLLTVSRDVRRRSDAIAGVRRRRRLMARWMREQTLPPPNPATIREAFREFVR